MPQRRIGKKVAGKCAVTVDTGLCMSRSSETLEGFRTGLQLDHDAAPAKNALANEWARIRPLAAAA